MKWRFLSEPRVFRAGECSPNLIYPLVRELADDKIDIAVACRALAVSRSGYYRWLGRPSSPHAQEDEYLLKLIEQIYADSRLRMVHPRVHVGLGLSVNLERVALLMRQAGIQRRYRRRHRGCTVCAPDTASSSDLVTATSPSPSQTGCGLLISRAPIMEGILYCAAVLDAYSRLIVGWSIAEHMRTELVTDAWAWPLSAANQTKNPIA
ncbi:MAG: hypothetical protein ACRDS9_23775 [Pseudonocardiaceae bacterium]